MAVEKTPKGPSHLLKLISVSFKEASLDSPSFRASTNFYHVQIESFESWIENVSRFYKHKFLPSLDDFKQISDTFFAQALPPADYLYNGVVENQMYTPMILEAFHSDLCSLSNRLLVLLRGDPESFLSHVLKISTDIIEPYREKRKNFDYYQSKHDTLLAKYQSTKISGPNVEPSSMREDAFQLFEARKSYLEASLDLAWEISQIQEALDVAISGVVGTLVRRDPMKNTIMNTPKGGDQAMDLYSRHSRWHLQMVENNASLLEDMKRAKEQVQAFTIKQLEPSRDLRDYNIKGINQASLLDHSSQGSKKSTEKSGWLFMKTQVGKPARTVWVRRWCFVKKSVFGMFLLSPAETAVEETDKFGVLLMNVRYDPNEERKFCFEAQIAGAEPGTNNGRSNTAERISLVFQTESLSDLKSWLQVFDEAKKHVLSLEKDDPEYELSFSRIPPIFFEFACSSSNQTDQQLTSFDPNGLYGKSILQLMKAAFSETGSIIFPQDSPFETPLLKTPISTKLTKLSVISSYYLVNDGVPNAITANFWGSVNWSEFCFNTRKVDGNNYKERQSPVPEAHTPQAERTSPTWSPMNYPDFYQRGMRNADLQFRSLFFPTAIQRNLERSDELLLLSFPCSWSPNTKQGFSGMCYITARNIYFYMNSMGFICLLNRSLEDIVSVEEVKIEGDNKAGILKLYDMNELSMSCSIFFDNPELIATKIRQLLQNGTTEELKSEKEILSLFASIDRDFNDRSRPSTPSTNLKGGEEATAVESLFRPLEKPLNELRKRQQSFQSRYCSVFKMDFNISPKGLMHVLFGDKSSAFPSCYLLADRSGSGNTTTAWQVRDSGDLKEAVRIVHFKIGHTQTFFPPEGNGSGDSKNVAYLDMLQRMKLAKEGEYYEVDQESGHIKVPFAKAFRVLSKYIIISRSDPNPRKSKGLDKASSCSLYLYYDVAFSDEITGARFRNLNVFDKFLKTLVLHTLRYESVLTRNVVQQYLDKIGKHGRVLKAIRLCGQLALVQGSEKTAHLGDNGKTNVARYSRSSLLRFMMRTILFYTVNVIFAVTRMFFQFIYAVLTNARMINKAVLLALALSIITNFSLLGKTTWSYWSVKAADKLFKSYVDIENKPMERALYIDDLDLLSDSLANVQDACLEKFLESTREVESKYRQTRHELALKRNELLVELKILNTMEKEMVHGEYVTFLLNEMQNCRTVEKDMPDVWANDSQLHDHCSRCSSEYKSIQHLL